MKSKQEVAELTEKTRKLLERMGAIQNTAGIENKKEKEKLSNWKVDNTAMLLQHEVDLFNKIHAFPSMDSKMLKLSYLMFTSYEYGLFFKYGSRITKNNPAYQEYKEAHIKNYNQIYCNPNDYADAKDFIIVDDEVKIRLDFGFDPDAIKNVTKVRPGSQADNYLKFINSKK